MSLEPRQVLAHCRIERKIDEGGMSEVCLAEDTKLDRKVVLKVRSVHPVKQNHAPAN